MAEYVSRWIADTMPMAYILAMRRRHGRTLRTCKQKKQHLEYPKIKPVQPRYGIKSERSE